MEGIMRGPHDIQQQFWNELVELRVHWYYLQEYHLLCDSAENKLNWALAIGSNASIASWAVWQKWPQAWASVIAASQVITALRPHMPFKKRSESILAASREIQDAVLWAEREWYPVSTGERTLEEIHECTMDLKHRKATTTATHLATSPLPKKAALLEAAEQQARIYFSVHYPHGGERT
jgi:hypothetical protein